MEEKPPSTDALLLAVLRTGETLEQIGEAIAAKAKS